MNHYPNSVTSAMLLAILGPFVLKLHLLMIKRFGWNLPCPFPPGKGVFLIAWVPSSSYNLLQHLWWNLFIQLQLIPVTHIQIGLQLSLGGKLKSTTVPVLRGKRSSQMTWNNMLLPPSVQVLLMLPEPRIFTIPQW
ncbi:hypothetical protein NC651_021396 [Populus alba x Populus x berolinensis]|nr:hypothetical protein NC651_021396 [Populus alba x Populus x berolinensis]